MCGWVCVCWGHGQCWWWWQWCWRCTPLDLVIDRKVSLTSRGRRWLMTSFEVLLPLLGTCSLQTISPTASDDDDDDDDDYHPWSLVLMMRPPNEMPFTSSWLQWCILLHLISFPSLPQTAGDDTNSRLDLQHVSMQISFSLFGWFSQSDRKEEERDQSSSISVAQSIVGSIFLCLGDFHQSI